MIIRATDKLLKENADPKAASVISSLHLAEVEQNGVPIGVTVPAQQKPPPPPNPNVLQQNNAKPQNGLNMVPAATGADLNKGEAQKPNQPPKTIAPEIPGVNHTSE